MTMASHRESASLTTNFQWFYCASCGQKFSQVLQSTLIDALSSKPDSSGFKEDT
jgi:transposase-like protein